MRKFLAALLAVFMLTAMFAVLPVSAEEATVVLKSKKDGTTPADAEALDLVVTEFMSNTTSSVGTKTADAFQYIEVYNRGTTDVNLYDLAIVRGANRTSADTWNKLHKFDAKLSINPGDIYANTAASNKNNPCMNPNTATVKPGQFAIIWFWNDSTNSVSNTFGASLGQTKADAEGKPVFHYYFREHYKAQTTDAAAKAAIDNALIVAVYAGSSTDTVNKPTFSLNTSGTYMYGLVKDSASQNFDVKNEAAFEALGFGDNRTFTQNEKIVCMWQWGTNTALSIPTHTSLFEGLASVYVPANCNPFYYNATKKAEDPKNEEKGTYYETGYVDGFREVGMVNFMEQPTIATMNAWQWADVDPDRAPEAMKATATWAEDARAAYNKENVEIGDTSVQDRPEEDKNQDDIHVDRDKLGNQGANIAQGGAADEGGLGIWLWVIIGGAAAVVLAGVAVALIIVLKKKNKPVAADDVASEGEVEIIDDQQE